MRITIHVEDTEAEQLRYEVERRVRLERDSYPAETNFAAVPSMKDPGPVPSAPKAKSRRKK